jgi:hypothetical protein
VLLVLALFVLVLVMVVLELVLAVVELAVLELVPSETKFMFDVPLPLAVPELEAGELLVVE